MTDRYFALQSVAAGVQGEVVEAEPHLAAEVSLEEAWVAHAVEAEAVVAAMAAAFLAEVVSGEVALVEVVAVHLGDAVVFQEAEVEAVEEDIDNCITLPIRFERCGVLPRYNGRKKGFAFANCVLASHWETTLLALSSPLNQRLQARAGNRSADLMLRPIFRSERFA